MRSPFPPPSPPLPARLFLPLVPCLCHPPSLHGLVSQVFVQTHIPRALEEVVDHEKDYDRLASGGGAVEGIYYQNITGMRQDMTGAREGPAFVQAAAPQVSYQSPSLGMRVPAPCCSKTSRIPQSSHFLETIRRLMLSALIFLAI